MLFGGWSHPTPYPLHQVRLVFGIGHNFQDRSSVHLNDRRSINNQVVYAQFSFGSLGLFKGSLLHFCKGVKLTLFQYPLNTLVLLVTVLLDIN